MTKTEIANLKSLISTSAAMKSTITVASQTNVNFAQ